MQFKIFSKSELEFKTGLRFDFLFKDKNGNLVKSVSIKEQDVFTIEPIFYKFFENYHNYGHWGVHIVEINRSTEFIKIIQDYINSLKEKKETEFCEMLNNKNFGKTYTDINNNREKIINFAYDFMELINKTTDCSITI